MPSSLLRNTLFFKIGALRDARLITDWSMSQYLIKSCAITEIANFESSNSIQSVKKNTFHIEVIKSIV